MSYDPNQPYGQPPPDPYGPAASPYGQPPSGQSYNQPQSGQPYNQPGVPSYDQPQSGQPYPTAPLPSGDPYANPSAGAYGNPGTGAYGADPYAAPADPYANPAGPYANPAGPYGYPGGPPGGYPAPPPPKKSKTGVVIGGIVAVVVIIIAVCSIGGWLISKNDSDTTADTTVSPSVTDGPSQASSPSAGPSIDTSRPEVSPAGAPFSFRLPVGFVEVTAPTSESTGASSEYTAAAATTRNEANDFLIVDSYTLPTDTSTVSESQLQTEFDGLVRRIGQDPSTRQAVTYNGYSGYWYRFDFGASKAYSYFIFNKTKEIQVRCQWADQETQIKTGCEYLLNSLTITA